MATVEISAVEFDTDVQGWLTQFGKDGRAAVRKAGQRTQSRAQQFCPVESGQLQASITATEGADGSLFYVDVGSDLEYAAFVEYGTSKMSAEPYLRPAFAEASVADLPLQKTL